MTDNNSDFYAKPRYYSAYYQLNSISGNILLIEAECLETPADADTIDRLQSSIEGIMCALGVIMVLIFGSTWQFYRSLNTIPDRSQVTQSKKISKNQKQQPKISKATQEIETLIQKNAIANGRF